MDLWKQALALRDLQRITDPGSAETAEDVYRTLIEFEKCDIPVYEQSES